MTGVNLPHECLLAPGLVPPSVDVKVDVPHRLNDAQAASVEGIGVGVDDIDENGVPWVQPHHRIRPCEVWLGRV